MQSPLKRPVLRNPFVSGLFVFAVLMLLTQFLTYQKYLLDLSEQQSETEKLRDNVSDQLKLVLQNALLTAESAAYLVEEHEAPKDFTAFAERLTKDIPSIHSMEIIQQGIITHVYPLEEKKHHIGIDILKGSHGKEVLSASGQKDIYFTGLFDLGLGGKGIRGYLPLKNDGEYSFIAIILKLNNIEEISSVQTAQTDYVYQISKINPETGQEEFLRDIPNSFRPEDSEMLIFAGRKWRVYSKFTGSNFDLGVILLAVLGFLLSLLAGFLTWFLVKRPAELEKWVNRQSRTISENQRRFQALVENSLDAVAIITPSGTIKYISPSVTAVLGYTAEDSLKLNLFDILHEDDKPFVIEDMTYLLQNPGQSIMGHVSRVKHKDGSWRWIESSITNQLNDPAINGIVDNFRDITDRKEAKDQLVKEKLLSEAVIDSLPGIFYFFNQEGRFLLWNQNFEEVSGYSGAEIEKMIPTDFFAEEDLPYITGKIQEVFEKGESDAETYLYTKNKEKIYHYFTGKTLLYNNELCLVGTGIDLTERKSAERQKEFERRNKEALINNTEDMIWSVDRNFNLIAANNSFLMAVKQQSGKEIREGDSILPENSNYLPEYLKYWQEIYRRGLRGESFKIEGLVPPDINTGIKEVYYEATINPIFNNDLVEGVACYSRDVTESRKYQKDIQEYNEKLQNAQHIANLGYWEHIPEKEAIFWSEKVFEIFEKDPTTFNPSIEDFFKQVHPEDREKFSLYAKKPILSDTQNIEYRILLNGQRIKWIHQMGKKMVDKKTGSASFKGILRDITERKKNEEALKEYNFKLKTAQEIAKLGYWEYDFTEEKITWSEQIYEIVEEDQKDFDITFEKYLAFIHPEDKVEHNSKLNAALQGGSAMHIEHRVQLNNGKTKWVYQRGRLVRDKSGKSISYRGIVQDITQKKLSEIELREQNEFIKTTLENLPVGIAVNTVDDGRATLMNKKFTEIYGWPKEVLTGVEPFFNAVFPDEEYRQKMKIQIMGDLESGDLSRMEWEGLKITTAEGKERIITAKNIPLYDQNLMISSVMDVTEKALAEEELEKSNERYQYVTKATFDAVWDLDLKKETFFWGEGFRTIFGYAPVSSSLDLWKDNIHQDDVQRVLQSFYSALSGKEKIWTEEYRFKRADGKYAYVKDRGIILRDVEMNAIRMIGAMQDISREKEEERRLRELNEQLDKNVKELAVSNAELEQFAYIASHDMQEPLRMVISFLTLLEKKYSDKLDDKGLQYINFAVDGATRMRQIILDILEFSRVGKTENLKPVNVNKILDNVVSLNKQIIRETNASLIYKDLPVIKAKETGVQQLFHNLISNSLKYKRKGVNPEIMIEAREEKEYWHFTLTDNGMGIPKDYFEKIFIIFQRLHTGENFSGTGIGLAICKKIVESLQGNIWVESEVGKGTAFHFTVKK